ncbi:hypothetical protein APED_02615 [Acanthopleuribacter pedis]
MPHGTFEVFFDFFYSFVLSHLERSINLKQTTFRLKKSVILSITSVTPRNTRQEIMTVCAVH